MYELRARHPGHRRADAAAGPPGRDGGARLPRARTEAGRQRDVTAPRLEIHLDRIEHNARTLVERLDPLGIAVTGVTKATLGSPEIARELLAAGVTLARRLADREHRAPARRRDHGPDHPDPLAHAQPGRPGRRERRPQPQHRARRHRPTLDAARRRQASATASSSWSNSATYARASCPATSTTPCDRSSTFPDIVAARHRHQPGLPERRDPRRVQHGRALRARDVDRGDVRRRPRHRLRRQLGEPRLGARPGRRHRSRQRSSPRRVDPARPRTDPTFDPRRPPHRRRSRSSARSSSPRSSRRRPRGERGQTAFGEPVDRPGRSRRAQTRVIVALGRQDVDPDGLVATRRLRDPRREQRPPRPRRHDRPRRPWEPSFAST